MFRSVIPRNTAALLILAASMASVHADQGGTTLAVVMTNDPQANQIEVYDTRNKALLQTLPTHRQHGTSGRARQAKSAGDVENRSASGNSRYRAPSERCRNRRSSRCRVGTRGDAHTVRVFRLS